MAKTSETKQERLLPKKDEQKLSWEETYKAMAAEQEDWDDFEPTLDALWAIEAEERVDAYE